MKGELFDGDVHPRGALSWLLRQACVNGDTALVVSLFQRCADDVQRVLEMSVEPVFLNTEIKFVGKDAEKSHCPDFALPEEIPDHIAEGGCLVAGRDGMAAALGTSRVDARDVWLQAEAQLLKKGLLSLLRNLATSKGPGGGPRLCSRTNRHLPRRSAV